MIQNMELNSNKNINNKDNAGDESEQMNKQSRKTFHNQSEFGEKKQYTKSGYTYIIYMDILQRLSLFCPESMICVCWSWWDFV